jgi:hypothetical protein
MDNKFQTEYDYKGDVTSHNPVDLQYARFQEEVRAGEESICCHEDSLYL